MSTTNPAAAFVACNSDFCWLRCPSNVTSNVEITSIWFDEAERRHYQQAPVSAWDQHPLGSDDHDDNEGLGGLLFAVAGDRILLAHLDHGTGSSHAQENVWSTVVPRRLLTSATSQRTIYSEHLRKFVIASIEPKERRGPPNGYRTIESSVQLLQVTEDETIIKQEDVAGLPKSLLVADFPLKNYERVSSIIEWVVKDTKNRPHHFVYVATSITVSPNHESGRRLFLQITDDAKFVLKKEKVFPTGIRCMTLYDDMHLITIFGKIMVIEQYEKDRMK